MIARLTLDEFGVGGDGIVAEVRFRDTGEIHEPAFVEPLAREAWRVGQASTWNMAQEQRLVAAIEEEVAGRDRAHNRIFARPANPAILEVMLDPGRDTESACPQYDAADRRDEPPETSRVSPSEMGCHWAVKVATSAPRDLPSRAAAWRVLRVVGGLRQPPAAPRRPRLPQPHRP